MLITSVVFIGRLVDRIVMLSLVYWRSRRSSSSVYDSAEDFVGKPVKD